jgi:hypothetical protein
VAGSNQIDSAQRLIEFLTAPSAAGLVRSSGLEPLAGAK